MTIQDVKDRGDLIVIHIPDTKTYKPRTACITEQSWLNLVRKYQSLRPPGTVGIHTFGSIPSKIATFLKLENLGSYTGHCFRRSSATLLAGRGANITTIKQHGGWKSTAGAEGYIEDSLKARVAIANQLVGQTSSATQSTRMDPVSTDNEDEGVDSTLIVTPITSSRRCASNTHIQNVQLSYLFSSIASIFIYVN
uniref:Tyr recombinase domain-containing protein n=1 Tax=Photinus pyralis TaxID=7054 RepID=A0A1Y1N1P7_PHOPY